MERMRSARFSWLVSACAAALLSSCYEVSGGADGGVGADDGLYEWHTFFGGGEDWESARSLALDGAGNIYVAGGSQAAWDGPDGHDPLHPFVGDGTNVFVLKLDPAGAYQWHTFYGSAGYSRTSGFAVAVGDDGDVYVTGEATDPWEGPDGQSSLHALGDDDAQGNTFDAFVLALDAGGAYQWHTFYGGLGDDGGASLAVDGDGNLYIAGSSSVSWSGPEDQAPVHPHAGGVDEDGEAAFDAFVLELDADGAYQWHAFFGGGGGDDSGQSAGVDGSGNVYVAGLSPYSWDGPEGQSPLNGHSPASYDAFVLKLDPGGAYQWHGFYGGGRVDSHASVALDGAGNVFVAGEATVSWNGPDGQGALHAHSGAESVGVVKLDSNGAYQWHTFYSGDSAEGDRGLRLDGSGSVYLTGSSLGSWAGPDGQPPRHAHAEGENAEGESSPDVLVLGLDSQGAYEWHSFYGSRGADADAGSALCVDGSGGIFVAGEAEASWKGPGGDSPLNAFSGYGDGFVLKLAR